MRPIWITRDSRILPEKDGFHDFHPVILCTASRRVSGAEISEKGYIQGAGDDNEGWSQGLTPQLFWKHKQTLMSATEPELPNIIQELVDEDKKAQKTVRATRIAPTTWLSIAPLPKLDDMSKDDYRALIICEESATRFSTLTLAKAKIHLCCRNGKLGSRDLRKELQKLNSLRLQLTSKEEVLVVCPDGKDISVGAALALLCLYANDDGSFRSDSTGSSLLSKDLIKRRLSWIMTSSLNAKPSRATLQSVNDFLLSSRSTANNPLEDTAVGQSSEIQTSSDYIFRQLSGKWHMERKITNSLQPGFAGSIVGSATFQERPPTSDEVNSEYLYSESGKFETALGVKMDIRRRWIWRLSRQDSISVHFVKTDGESEDYVYNVLAFQPSALTDGGLCVITAHASHPCGDDFYDSVYEFHIGERGLARMEVKHKVKGPTKDYVSETWYSWRAEDEMTR